MSRLPLVLRQPRAQAAGTSTFRRTAVPAPTRVGILLFDEVEVLDVFVRGGLPIVADGLLGDAPPVDVALVPGGVTTRIEDPVATSAGVSAGIDLALHLVARFT